MARGVVAAGHPLTAQAGADVLRAGGNAVDAALAAMLTSFVAEPLLTGLGAGGYMLVAAPGREPGLVGFFVSAPGPGAGPGAGAAGLLRPRARPRRGPGPPRAADPGRRVVRRRHPGLQHRRVL